LFVRAIHPSNAVDCTSQPTLASQQDHLVCSFCFNILDTHSNNGTTRVSQNPRKAVDHATGNLDLDLDPTKDALTIE